MPIRLTKKEFVDRSNDLHENKYDYSKVNYKNAHTPTVIICPKHGDFLQKPYCHLRPYGCPMCGGTKKSTTKEFIEKAKKIHGDIYSYEKSKYTLNRENVEIICFKHGSFYQKPNYHLLGEGCPRCTGLVKLTKKEFIEKSKLIHGNKYDYSKVSYINTRTKVEIVCLKHGIFRQKPNSHLNGNGCERCTYKISKPEVEFLSYLKIQNQNYRLNNWKRKKVDGYDPKTNTVYEFLGDYYHGNPKKYKLYLINPTCKKTYGELYFNTIDNFRKLKKLGYAVKYIWESDWKKFKSGLNKIPHILTA
jgi:hypothetical protein